MSLIGDGLDAAVQKAFTRPPPKSAGAQMRYHSEKPCGRVSWRSGAIRSWTRRKPEWCGSRARRRGRPSSSRSVRTGGPADTSHPGRTRCGTTRPAETPYRLHLCGQRTRPADPQGRAASGVERLLADLLSKMSDQGRSVLPRSGLTEVCTGKNGRWERVCVLDDGHETSMIELTDAVPGRTSPSRGAPRSTGSAPASPGCGRG